MMILLLLLLLCWISDASPVATVSIDAKLVLRDSAARGGGIGFKAIHVAAPQSRVKANPSPSSAAQKSLFPYSAHIFQQHTKNPAALRSSTTTLGRKFGEYYTSIKLGSPGQEAILIVDTGSELTWLQCLPCKVCAPSVDTIYDAARSASYRPVTCNNSQLCSNSSQGTYAYCARGSQCQFAAFYGDGSFSYGSLSTDTLIMETVVGGKPVTVQDFAFGCAQGDLELVPTGASGILGLNAGKMALPMQLGQRFGWKFSHCFPDRSSHLNSTGVVFFGNAELPHEQVQYTSVALTNSELQRKFYHVALKGVSINSHELVFLPRGSVVILDSGSSFSSFVRPFHSQLREAFLKHRPPSLKHLEGDSFGDLGTCFKVSNDDIDELHRTLPSLSLVFEDGVTIGIPSIGVLLPVARFQNHVKMCFAFEDGGPNPVNVIGNYQQQNLWVEYDIQRSRVGFARASCVID
ncbi:hypothetical protein SELMODRAFT_431957 [Selaginella moellendorffii]|uniref:Peptidase A1 domain-containing protein n=1 Tax=Selaginella moellendorffii TaxID=88036 RepID=D8TEH7_SELML|nr:aspartyl protease family protein 2 [Selaginella moellendorffii]EFJ04945.1 hypothetical protein SELMODRAFT_431957 [Selaginella moellendorffii]|eukprot:XP_002994005.1 aspartyl protease family protein 2 [Selaginella moellendorffii]